jgi:site-specific recombinase XerD
MKLPTTDIISAESSAYLGLPTELQETLEAAIDYLRAQKAPATLRGYQSDFAIFRPWCERYHLSTEPATPETIVLFLTDQAKLGLSVTTLERRLAAIHYVHRLKGLFSPTDDPKVRGGLAGIRRIHGSKPRRVKDPVLDNQLLLMLAKCPATLIGIRDQAILALGFAGAFRRSELAALKVEDLHFHPDGHVICTIRHSKTDQAGVGFDKPIYNGKRLQPVTHLQTWLDTSGVQEGLVFRRIDWGGAALEAGLSGYWIARIVQRYAAASGVDPTMIGAHSLRSGFITSAGERNAPLYKIMEITGQKEPRTVLKYLRHPNLFRDHVGENFL